MRGGVSIGRVCPCEFLSKGPSSPRLAHEAQGQKVLVQERRSQWAQHQLSTRAPSLQAGQLPRQPHLIGPLPSQRECPSASSSRPTLTWICVCFPGPTPVKVMERTRRPPAQGSPRPSFRAPGSSSLTEQWQGTAQRHGAFGGCQIRGPEPMTSTRPCVSTLRPWSQDQGTWSSS